ncbi:MAG: WbqC family protein, partial [Fulvivirga sp.]|nr:WbqC family protein [Fulvivirga sp.]
RCHILGANQVHTLSVPVIGGRRKIKMKDIAIDHSQRWQKDHWRTIQSAYGRAPFFEFFAEYFAPFFSKREKFLWNLNLDILTTCLKLLQKQVNFQFSDTYQKSPDPAEIIDFRSQIHPKKPPVNNQLYSPVPYTQVFGNKFVPNLSIIDLLFCEGPNAGNIVTKSLKQE